MKPTVDSLLEEVVVDEASDSFREETLRTSLFVLRRRRHRKALVRRSLMFVIPFMVITGAVSIYRLSLESEIAPIVAINAPEVSTSGTITATTIQVISDQELLALFPNRAIALIGENGHQTLVFLDAESEVRN